MRAADRLEIEALGFASPVRALEHSLAVSQLSAAACVDGEVLALYGVMELSRPIAGPRVAVPWLLTSTAVERYPLTFWRASKQAVRELAGKWALLSNLVDARYASALTYLARLGFRVLPARPHGLHGELFHPVVLGG